MRAVHTGGTHHPTDLSSAYLPLSSLSLRRRGQRLCQRACPSRHSEMLTEVWPDLLSLYRTVTRSGKESKGDLASFHLHKTQVFTTLPRAPVDEHRLSEPLGCFPASKMLWLHWMVSPFRCVRKATAFAILQNSPCSVFPVTTASRGGHQQNLQVGLESVEKQGF